MTNKFQKNIIPDIANTGRPRGFKFIEKELQTQVHPSAAGPNPVAQKSKNNLK
jgi:hypothetical protein